MHLLLLSVKPVKNFADGRMVSEEIVVLSTATAKEASALATTLVEEALVACVNIMPVTSVYKWKNEIVSDDEKLLVMKTTRDNYARLEARIKELHTYDVPEVIALKIELGSTDYLNWLRDCVSTNKNPAESSDITGKK
jgi:periplasmic divalent cation tolerance protein